MPNHTLILEGIVTTLNADRTVNVSPMGPIVDRDITRLWLRPFKTSRTYLNLKQHGEGVFHVTDDVELIARCAVDTGAPLPKTYRATSVEGHILSHACRWYAFVVRELDDEDERTSIRCEIVDHGRIRDFFGFNRAKHAVIEAAILATRIHLTDAATIRHEFRRLAVLVEKTGGDQEHRAFARLNSYIEAALRNDASDVK